MLAGCLFKTAGLNTLIAVVYVHVSQCSAVAVKAGGSVSVRKVGAAHTTDILRLPAAPDSQTVEYAVIQTVTVAHTAMIHCSVTVP